MAETVNVNDLSRSLRGKVMTMRSPVMAMLWENWRLTRVEAAWKLVMAIIGGLAVLVVFAAAAPNRTIKDFGAVVAFIVIVLPNAVGWFSVLRLNGARAGFPFSLHYTRPVRTAVMVGVPMVYQVVMPVALYLLSALFLRVVSGYPFPLMPFAVWIAALNLVQAPTNWAIPSRVVTVLGSMAAGLGWTAFAADRRIAGPAMFNVPLTDYALVGAIGIVSFAAAVAGVARQRRGDAPAISGMSAAGGYPEWLVNLFRVPCPTSSATRAQIWFELKSRGLPVLAIGSTLAILNLLLFAISVHYGNLVRVLPTMSGIISVLAVLVLGSNAFDIRGKGGRLYVSPFEVTLPCSTARLTALKVLVRSVCVLVSLVAVSVSLWASMSFVAVSESYAPLKGYQPLRSWQGAIESAVGSLTGYQRVALAIVASMGIAILVATWAAIGALLTRYRRRLGLLGWLVLLHGAVLFPLVMIGYRGFASQALWAVLLNVLVWMTRWIDAPLIVFATLYVSWRVRSERLLTLRSVCAAVLVSAAFGTAWVMLLRAAGVQLGDVSAPNAFWLLSPMLLPVMASVLAPWSLDRIRHT